jgi:peptidoglycan hydrolase-like protein with peptidoglycan-binding domain
MKRRSIFLGMLLAALIPATPAVAASHHAPILREGMRGPAVRQLQHRLHVHATGFFGPVTLRAVERFQRRHGLLVDGQVGPHTRRALHTARRRGRRVARRAQALGRGTLHVGMTGRRVAELQRLLGVHVDGVFGPQTRAAVVRFQRRHRLRAVGWVGPHTRRALAAALGHAHHHARRIHHRHHPRRRRSRHAAAPRVFRYGMRGVRVAMLQVELGIAADGAFGSRMLAAVKRFQAAHGLAVDSIVGPATLAAVHRSRYARQRTVRAAVAAVSRIGTPYVFGGASPRGFDCSGLVMWAYARSGVRVPRTSYQQYGAGRSHPHLGRLRAGDLIFFDRRSHVGIALGHRLVVRAPHTGARVGIARISGWFVRHWAGATRVIG